MKTTILTLAFAAFTCGAFAQNAPADKKSISEIQHNQYRRIKEGIKSGELTRAEAERLKKAEKEIAQDKKLAKSDGDITRGERKLIRKEEYHTSKAIYAKKHNKADR